jgi:hypothetical protein
VLLTQAVTGTPGTGTGPALRKTVFEVAKAVPPMKTNAPSKVFARIMCWILLILTLQLLRLFEYYIEGLILKALALTGKPSLTSPTAALAAQQARKPNYLTSELCQNYLKLDLYYLKQDFVFTIICINHLMTCRIHHAPRKAAEATDYIKRCFDKTPGRGSPRSSRMPVCSLPKLIAFAAGFPSAALRRKVQI